MKHQTHHEQGGKVRRAVRLVMVSSIIVALAGAVVFLASDINQGRFRLQVHKGNLIVENGRAMPWGFEAYVPKTETLRPAYAPIPMPPYPVASEDVDSIGILKHGEVDTALFGLLRGWVSAGMASNMPTHLRYASAYVDRLNLLPSLSQPQRDELRVMQADLSYRNGEVLAGQVSSILSQALAHFRRAGELGTSQPAEASRWIQQIETYLSVYPGGQSALEQPQSAAGRPSVSQGEAPTVVVPQVPQAAQTSQAPQVPQALQAPQAPAPGTSAPLAAGGDLPAAETQGVVPSPGPTQATPQHLPAQGYNL